MNIIEAQANLFLEELFPHDLINSMEDIKKRLDIKLLIFRNNRFKLDFLKTLIVVIQDDITNHQANCKTKDCEYDKEKRIGVFLIEQEIDYINETYIFIPKSDDEFTVEEETSLHGKLNEILDRLNNQGLGQEILFNEIESLKNHFNLGKKTWFQLAYGKVFSVTGDKMIEESVSKEIINQITDMFNHSVKLIP